VCSPITLSAGRVEQLKPRQTNTQKISKNADLPVPATCVFHPLAFETHGAIHSLAFEFLNAVGGRLVATFGDHTEPTFLWQRMSGLMQRFNATLIGETFIDADEAPDL